MKNVPAVIVLLMLASCHSSKPVSTGDQNDAPLQPVVVTEKVYDDSDDPAIWIDPADSTNSLIIGTDKNKDSGSLFVFDLKGKIDSSRSVHNLKRPNNVDVAYGLSVAGKPTDIAVCTERDRQSIRVFSVPAMVAIDGGGIPVFTGEQERLPMGIALFTRVKDGAIFAIVGRKSGPADGYLEQYLLADDGTGVVKGTLVRRFGKYSGIKEIESIAVDNELGYVYYCDEGAGIHKYYADPEMGNAELAVFGLKEFREDNEGISIYKFPDGTGYILVSDQSANKFNIYPREGKSKDRPHAHTRIASLPFSTDQSDGSDVTSVSLPGFTGGLFVAMSTNGTFQYYRWADIARRAGLKVR